MGNVDLMDIGTVLGFVVGIGLFVGSVLFATPDWAVFLNAPSLAIVVGGTFASAFVSYRTRYVLIALGDIFRIMGRPSMGREYLNAEVGRMIEWAYVVRKDGLPELERMLEQQREGFVSFALSLVVSGYDGADIREILKANLRSDYTRQMVSANILRTMGSASPAFGMIGTLVGLVVMLGNLGNDPAQIGRGMAVALITTLYGVILARLILIPAALKTQQNFEIVRHRNTMMADGFSMLAEGKSPRFIQDKLNAYLDEEVRFDIGSQLR